MLGVVMRSSTETREVVVRPELFTSQEEFALAGFLAGYGGLTREAYMLDLRQYVAWCSERRVTLFGARRADIEAFGRHLVQGVDVWLNNPRRPLEASGTSGQKVVLNGGLNLSVLDGWWAEAYDGLNGFAIGKGRTHSNMDVHDSRDGEDLYRVLSGELIPLFYDRDRDGLPRGWIKRMKRTIRTLGWRFNADRMVMDYTQKCYVPAAGGTSSDIRPLC